MSPLPWLFKVLVAVLVVAGCVAFAVAVATDGLVSPNLLGHVADLALALTLAAVVLYVYYTHLLAKDASTPSAAFALKAYPQDNYAFMFLIVNHSKFSLQCWCRLNARVYGQPVSLGGFYDAKNSFDVQPFGAANGWFRVQDLLQKAGRTIEDVKKAVTASGDRGPLSLDIEFWYHPTGSRQETRNPRQPHYFDFHRDIMVTDF